MNINVKNETLKQKPKQVFSNISLITKSSDKKNPSVKIYPVLEKENVQRTITSSLKQFSEKSSSKIVSNNCNIFSKEVKIVLDKDTIINNTELKTNKLDNEMLMNLSTDEANIFRASFPINCINVSVPECANFLMGVSKSSKDCSIPLVTSQNNTEK